MAQEIQLQIILTNPPGNVDFGLQEGSGSNYKTVQLQRSGAGDLSFELIIQLKKSDKTSPDFSGPSVQGPSGKRFIYIDIGTYAGQAGCSWGRRLKVPLESINQEMIEDLSSNNDLMLVCSIEGTGKDGGPNCGTVKPFSGWHLANN